MKRLVLLQARLSCKLTQEQLAQKLGISKQQYSRIENGLQNGSIEMWDILEDIFHIPQRELRDKENGLKNKAQNKIYN